MVNIRTADQEFLLLECYPDVEGRQGDKELSELDLTIAVAVEAPKKQAA
jgi:hypothetical protein